MSSLARARRSTRPTKPIRRWRNQGGLLVPTGEAVAEALAGIPAGAPWPWACLRLMPMIRGARMPHFDDDALEELGFQPASAFPSLSMAPGVDVTFAIEVDPAMLTVDQARLDAWDKSLDEVAPAAFANLRRAVGTWDGAIYKDDSYPDTPARMLTGWPHWAVSLILLPDELMRIFGRHDQLFVAPYHCNLISLPIDADRDVAGGLLDLFGYINPQSLLMGLPAFVLHDGVLTTEELPSVELGDEKDDPWAESDW